MSSFNGKDRLQVLGKSAVQPIIDYRRKLRGLKRVLKDLVLENSYLCDEVAKVHEDILLHKEERRFLLKKLHQLEASAGIDSTLQPVGLAAAIGENQPTTSATKKVPKRKIQQESSEELNGSAVLHNSKPKPSGKNKAIKEEHFDIDSTD